MGRFTWVALSKLFKLSLSLATEERGVCLYLSHGPAVSGKYHLCFLLGGPVAVVSRRYSAAPSPLAGNPSLYSWLMLMRPVLWVQFCFVDFACGT